MQIGLRSEWDWNKGYRAFLKVGKQCYSLCSSFVKREFEGFYLPDYLNTQSGKKEVKKKTSQVKGYPLHSNLNQPFQFSKGTSPTHSSKAVKKTRQTNSSMVL